MYRQFILSAVYNTCYACLTSRQKEMTKTVLLSKNNLSCMISLQMSIFLFYGTVKDYVWGEVLVWFGVLHFFFLYFTISPDDWSLLSNNLM